MPTRDEVLSYLDEALRRYPNVPRDVAHRLVNLESGGNAAARSAKGALGVGQLMPDTAREMGLVVDGQRDDRLDPRKNIEASLGYLSKNIDRFGGDVSKGLAAYHAGPGAVERAGGIPNTHDGIMATGEYVRRLTGGAQEPTGTRSLAKPDASGAPAGRRRYKAGDVIDEPLLPVPTGTSSLDSAPAPAPTLWDDVKNRLGYGWNEIGTSAREGVRQVLGDDVVSSIESLGSTLGMRNIDTTREQLDAELSPAMRESMAKDWWDEEKGTFGPAWGDWRSYVGPFAQSIPETALTMLPAFRIAKTAEILKKGAVMRAAIARGATKEAAEKAAEEAGAKALARTALIAGGTLEGVSQAGGSAVQVRSEIMRMPDAVLDKSDAFKGLVQQFGGDRAAAKKQLADDAATRAYIAAGVVTGIFGGQGDLVIAKLMRGEITGGIVKRMASGAVAEGLFEEAPQSAGSAIAENLAVQQADPTIPTTRGAVNQAMGGGVVGGLMGAGMGAAFGGRGEPGQRRLAPQAGGAPAVTPPAVKDDPFVSGSAIEGSDSGPPPGMPPGATQADIDRMHRSGQSDINQMRDRSGGRPETDETGNQTLLEPVEPSEAEVKRRLEQVARMQDGDVGRPSDNAPYKARQAAVMARGKRGLKDTHDVVELGPDAWVLRPRTIEDQEPAAQDAASADVPRETAELPAREGELVGDLGPATIMAPDAQLFPTEQEARDEIARRGLRADDYDISDEGAGFLAHRRIPGTPPPELDVAPLVEAQKREPIEGEAKREGAGNSGEGAGNQQPESPSAVPAKGGMSISFQGQTWPVATVEEAGDKWLAYLERVKEEAGAGPRMDELVPEDPVILDADGKPIGTLAMNGTFRPSKTIEGERAPDPKKALDAAANEALRDAAKAAKKSQTGTPAKEGEHIPAKGGTARERGREAADVPTPRSAPDGLSVKEMNEWYAGYDEVMIPRIPPRDPEEGPAIMVDVGDGVEEFIANAAPMQRSRMLNALNTDMTFDGKRQRRREGIREKVEAGSKIVVAKDGMRRLQTPDGAYVDEKQITKTGMDYAAHLINARGTAPTAEAPVRVATKASESDKVSDATEFISALNQESPRRGASTAEEAYNRYRNVNAVGLRLGDESVIVDKATFVSMWEQMQRKSPATEAKPEVAPEEKNKDSRAIYDIPLDEWKRIGKSAFVHAKGKRRIELLWNNAVFQIKQQRNGKLTAPVDDVLAAIHRQQVESRLNLERGDRSDASNPVLGAGMRERAQARLAEGKYVSPEVMASYPDLAPQSASPKVEAQHVDDGKIEAVTPEVIREAIKESARDTTMNLREARDAVLKKVDAAIAKAKPFSEYPNVIRSIDRNGAQSYEVRSPTEKYPTATRMAEREDLEKEIGYLTFKVEGDGRFKVLNTKESLKAFRDKLAHAGGFAPLPKSRPHKGLAGLPTGQKAMTPAVIEELWEDGEYLTAYEGAKAGGKPLMFGTTDDAAPSVYHSAASTEVAGYKAFVGKRLGRKKEEPWSVIELGTGLAFGGGASAADAVSKAKERAARDGKEKVDSIVAKSKKISQEELERKFVSWATEQDQKLAEKSRMEDERERKVADRDAEQSKDGYYDDVYLSTIKEKIEEGGGSASIRGVGVQIEAVQRLIDNGKLVDVGSGYIGLPSSEQAAEEASEPAKPEPKPVDVPEGYKKVTEYFKDNKTVPGYAEFSVGEQVRNKETRAIGEVESYVGEGPIFSTYLVKFPMGNQKLTRQYLEAVVPEAAPAEKASKPPQRESKKDKAEDGALVARRKEFYAPGNIIRNDYGRDHDRVLEYRDNDPRDVGAWGVRVEKVEQRDGEWVATERPRWHSTEPDKKDAVVAKAPPEVEKRAAAKAPTESKASASIVDDVGENLKANRRNFKAGLTWDEIKNENAALKRGSVVKGRVWARPDYEAMVDGGMNPLIARVVKQVYDGIANAPPRADDASLEGYIAAVNRVRDGLLAWTEDQAALAAFGQETERAIEARKKGPFSRTPLDSRVLIERIWKDTPRGLAFRDSDAAKDMRLMGGNRFLAAVQIDLEGLLKATSDIIDGWPARKQAWQKQGFAVLKPGEYVVEQDGQHERWNREEKRSVPVEGVWQWRIKSNTPQGGRSNWIAVGPSDPSEGGTKALLVNDRSSSGFHGAFDTEQAALDGVKEIIAKQRKASGQDIRGTNVSGSERTGPDRRGENENISADRLMQTFGFRGVNFGRKGYIGEAERQAYVNAAYDAFHDLAEVLGVPPKALSLGGMLGIAFGAQGRGGHAAAHFVPGVNEINLTKGAGAGTLAHEWGHALDHYFARQAGFEAQHDPFLSRHLRTGAGIRPEIVKQFNAIVGAMNKRAATPEEAEKGAIDSINMARQNVESWLKAIRGNTNPKEGASTRFDELADRIRKGDIGAGSFGALGLPQTIAELREVTKQVTGRHEIASNMKGLMAAAHHLKYVVENKDRAASHVPQVSTNYARESYAADKEKGGKEYWRTPWEMFARAFESFVADKITLAGNVNTFLSDAQQRAAATVPVTDRDGTVRSVLAFPYPRGVDREAVNKAFADLVGEIKVRDDGDMPVMFADLDVQPRSRGVREEGLPADARNLSSFRNTQPLKKHADYKAAKSGDAAAALRLVKDLVNTESLEAARKAFGPDAIFVFPHADEATGKNAIPGILASVYAKASGGRLGELIVQTNRVHHTGAKAMERLIARPAFSGNVEKGGKYVVVDDVTTMGGTLAELADHIRAQGGQVVGSAVLVDASRTATMAPSAATVRLLETRYGQEIRDLFGVAPAALTAAEAQYLAGFRDADSLRARAAAAKRERVDRLRAKGTSDEGEVGLSDLDREPPSGWGLTGEGDGFSVNGRDGKVLTDETSKADAEALRSSIEGHLQRSTPNARVPAGAFEVVALPGESLLRRIAEAFGVRVVGFRVNDPKLRFFGGATNIQPGVIYILEDNPRPHLSILGHELLHNLRKNSPALYEQFRRAIQPYVTQHWKRIGKDAPAWKHHTEDKLMEELLADLVGDGFLRRDFWQRLGQQNPNLLQRVYNAVLMMVDKVWKALGGHAPTPRVREYMLDFQAAVRIAADVMAQYGKSVEQTAAQAPAFAEAAGPLWRSALMDAMQKVPWSKAGAIETAQFGRWLAARAKDGTFKPDELTWSGLEDYLATQGKTVTRAQVVEYLAHNGVRVEEKELGEVNKESLWNDVEAAKTALRGLGWREDIDPVDGTLNAIENGVVTAYAAGGSAEDVEWQDNDEAEIGLDVLPQNVRDAAERLGRALENASMDLDENGDDFVGTRYEKYQLPGGKNYRELLLTLPERTSSMRVEQTAANSFTAYGPDGSPLADGSTAEIATTLAKRLVGVKDSSFRSTHFDQPNILAHVRFNERADADGKRVLFIEEIQSDFGQQTKRQRDAVVKSVDDNFEAIVKRMEAAGVLEVECD